MPGTDGNMGRLSAYETNTMKPLWTLQQRSPFLTGVVSTAGNVAFVGDFDRVFHAFDTKTGKQLWTDAAGHHGAGPYRLLHGGRQTVYRGDDRAWAAAVRSRSPPSC